MTKLETNAAQVGTTCSPNIRGRRYILYGVKQVLFTCHFYYVIVLLSRWSLAGSARITTNILCKIDGVYSHKNGKARKYLGRSAF